MGKVVFLGHGAFDNDATKYPEVGYMLVPPGTTIKFYSEIGESLRIPATRNDSGELISDYKKIVSGINGWEKYQSKEAPLEAGKVAPNMRLSPEDSDEERTLAESLDWGGAEVVSLPKGSDKWYLCQGDASTCPTPKLHVAESRHDELKELGKDAEDAFKKWLEDGASGDLPESLKGFEKRLADVPKPMYQYVSDGVPEERWLHNCDGVLGVNEYGGQELYWMACTSLYAGALQEWKDLIGGSRPIAG